MKASGRARRALIWTVLIWPIVVGVMVLADRGADWDNPVVRALAILALPAIYLIRLALDPVLTRPAPQDPRQPQPPPDPPH